MLKWARANGAPWDWQTCKFAAAYGHIKTLQHGAPWDEDICWYAAMNLHLNTLQWILHQNDSNASWSTCDIKAYEELLISPEWRGVALVLFSQHRGTLRINGCVKQFIVGMIQLIPLTTPLCNMVINYC